MKPLNQLDEKLRIDYPCDWQFKLIGMDQVDISEAVKAIVTETNYDLSLGNISANGKYVSMTLLVKVVSDDERHALYDKFKQHKSIKIVL